jgi:Tfp pilus assembly protein PilF
MQARKTMRTKHATLTKQLQTACSGMLLVAVLTALGGCQMEGQIDPSRYATVHPDPRRDTQRAAELNAKAVALLKDGHLAQAEKELQAALAADLFFGPAHNNLGTVYYRQKKYYLAAWEFQYAAKVMPHKAEPRSNLGMVFEAVGKLDDAAKWYEEALKLEPEVPQISGNLARVYVRQSRKDDRTRQLLGDVVLKDDRPDWVGWAREHLALMGSGRSAASQPTTSVTEERMPMGTRSRP